MELLAGRKRPQCLIGTVNTGNRFPRLGQHAQMMEAPTFRNAKNKMLRKQKQNKPVLCTQFMEGEILLLQTTLVIYDLIIHVY